MVKHETLILLFTYPYLLITFFTHRDIVSSSSCCCCAMPALLYCSYDQKNNNKHAVILYSIVSLSLMVNSSHMYVLSFQSIFQFMSKQRKLTEAEEKEVKSMIKLKANRKLIQNHLQKATGKKVVMKDLHNIGTHCNGKKNDLQELVNHMKSVEGMNIIHAHIQGWVVGVMAPLLSSNNVFHDYFFFS